MSVPAHQITTANLGAAYPFVAGQTLGSDGVYIGRDLLGGAFVFDPFQLYASGILTNPNMVVVGQIGRGKSAFVKSYLWRQAVFGRQAWVIDPKGEYGHLARSWGTSPIFLRPGGETTLNPLSVPDDLPKGEGERRQSELLASLASACLGRSLLPTEHTAIELALKSVVREKSGEPVISDVVRRLLRPDGHAASEIYSDEESLAAFGRDAGLELRRLVDGDLKGMFDGPTTPGIDLDGPLVVLDLSAVYSSKGLGVLMTCASAWLSSFLMRKDGKQRLVVIDEAWAILSNIGVARWLQSSWKLARAYGVSNIAVFHRVSDLNAVGSSDSEQVSLASGLLADSETRVVYSQPPGELDSCTGVLGLTSTEAALLPRLRRGVAVWKVGGRSFLVEHRLGAMEREIVDTDQAMAEVAGR